MILLWVALSFMAGIFMGSQILLAGLPLLVAGLAQCMVAILVWRHRRLRLSLLILSACTLGAMRAEDVRFVAGPSDVAYYNGTPITLTGVVSAEPDVRDSGVNYVVTISNRVRGSRSIPLHGQVEVHTPPSQLLDEGDVIQLTGLLTGPRNSPTIPYRDILANRGIYSTMDFPRLFVTGHDNLGLISVASSVRSWIEGRITTALPEPEATLLIAILIGARSAQLGSLVPLLISSGLIHLIAVSGFKVALVAGTVHAFLRRTASRLPALVASTVIVFTYWMIAGATVAGLRASIMWLLVFLAAYLGRITFAPISLALSSAGMLALQPSLLYDTGFQLTVLGTAGIICFSPFIQRVTSVLPSALAASFGTTFSAQLGVLPVQVASFHVISPISVLANGLVLPFIPLTMVFGFVLALVPISPISTVSYGLVRAVILVAQWTTRVPGAASHISTLPVSVTVLYYAGVICLAIVGWRLGSDNQARHGGNLMFGLAAIVFGLGLSIGPPSSQSVIRSPATNSLLVSYRGRNILINGGTQPSALLERLGNSLPLDNRQLDVVIDTDPRAANAASLLAVAQHLSVGRVFDTGIEYASQTYGRWRAWLREHRIVTSRLRAGVLIRIGRLTIRALAPDGIYPDPRNGEGILVIRDGSRRYLFVGEASAEEQQDLPFRTQVSADTALISGTLDPVLRRGAGIRRVVHLKIGTFLRLP